MMNSKRSFLTLCLTLLLSISLSGCVLIYSNFDFTSEIKPLEETTLQGSGSNRFLLVDISGELIDLEEAGLLGLSVKESVVANLHEQLEMARKNHKKIRAVLLRINTPGGSVTASDLLYEQIRAFRVETGIPVYAIMMDVAASGGYYIAMAADKIYAHPTTITGSIGVIMFNISVEGLMKKVGVASKVIKSGRNKDIGSPLKDLEPEEKAILQGGIDDLYARFVDVVASGRPKLTRSRILELADGRIYTSRQAKENGLIDQVSYLPEIVRDIEDKLGIKEARIVTYKRPNKYMNNIFGSALVPEPKGISLLDPAVTKPLRPAGRQMGFYYLWEP